MEKRAARSDKDRKRVARLAALYTPVAASLCTVLTVGVVALKGPQAAGD